VRGTSWTACRCGSSVLIRAGCITRAGIWCATGQRLVALREQAGVGRDTIGRGSTQDTRVSLCTPRALLLRPRDGGEPALRFEVGHGDLLVMGGSCQRTWLHAVPKTTRSAGPRISVQFRPRDVR
jgi:2OG-Fe(II) oxygenase superfamily